MKCLMINQIASAFLLKSHNFATIEGSAGQKICDLHIGIVQICFIFLFIYWKSKQ